MMRQTMETARSSSFREPLVPRHRIRHTRKIPGTQKRCHASDIRLEGESRQIEMQFDVSVEVIRNAIRLVTQWDRGRGRSRELDPAFDFVNFGCIVVNDAPIRSAELLLNRPEFRSDRIQDAL